MESLPDSAQICSCFDVTKGDIIQAIHNGCQTVADIKAETKAGTGCGGCVPLITQVLNAELTNLGIEVNHHLCEHFAYSRQELYHLIRVEKITTFDELLGRYGEGYGCEVCKPTIGSLLASCRNDYILRDDLVPLQDTNDNFLANMQKDGTYSVIPRSPAAKLPWKVCWLSVQLHRNTICIPKLPAHSALPCSGRKSRIYRLSGKN